MMNRWMTASMVLAIAGGLMACQPAADETDEAPAAVAPVGPLDDAISAHDLPPDDAIPAEEEVPDDETTVNEEPLTLPPA